MSVDAILAPPAESEVAIQYDRSNFTDEQLRFIYQTLVFPRQIEEKMLILLRQNRISKWFSGIGQEAVAVGTTLALQSEDYIFPLHRNLGVFTTRNMPLAQLFCQWQGKKNGFTKGRDRSFHFGAPEYRVIGMISHLGAMLGVADGVGLASNLEQGNYISLVYSGDGGASEGDFHEALNTAAVWDLPVIFLIENNGYGLSTPSSEQFRCRQFVDKAIGYGMAGFQMDGNNILEVYETTARVAAYVRQHRKPVILEAMTFRMRGHEEASGTKYVPKPLMESWALKDPVVNFEKFLLKTGVITVNDVEGLKAHYKLQIETAIQVGFDTPDVVADTAEELADVYDRTAVQHVAPAVEGKEKRLVDAISEGLAQAMERDPKLIIMGQDVAEYGGVFKVTQGFVERFGKSRVRNTPLCESAIIGCGLGLSLRGFSSVIEMQFADFVSCGFNQIVNNLAKNHYRWGHAPRVVIRMPTGAGVAAGPFHSQSNEAWFFHTPGLKVVYPATAYEAKGLLTASILDPNPVLFFEHKKLYRSIQDLVPDAYYTLTLSKAVVMGEGSDCTVVTYGWGVHWAMEARARLAGQHSVEVINLRTLLPWDQETVMASVRKTGKCLVLHEDCLTGGIGAEIAATVGEMLFSALDAPVMRVGSLDTPVPFAEPLEQNFLPEKRFIATLERLLRY